jgi:hypothetical protein
MIRNGFFASGEGRGKMAPRGVGQDATRTGQRTKSVEQTGTDAVHPLQEEVDRPP